MTISAFRLTLGMAALAAANAHAADNWPSRPIRMVVPFPAGSSVDAATRAITPSVSEALGQSVVIDNRAGASGARGGWGFVRGGMGALSNAIADSARAAGAEIRCDADVAEITVAGGRATGVTLRDGTRIEGRVVASSAHPQTTFLGLVGRDHLPDDLAREVDRYRTRSGSVKSSCHQGMCSRMRPFGAAASRCADVSVKRWEDTGWCQAWQSAAARMNSLGPPIRCRSGIRTSAARSSR